MTLAETPSLPAAGTVVMPRLSDSMEEGTVLAWLKADGDAVSAGEDLVEIETDKATTVYASELQGTLRILVEVGETVEVGQAIAEIGEAGAPPGPSTPSAEPSAERSPSAAPPASAEPISSSPALLAGKAAADVGRPAATPVARRMARTHEIDLSEVPGSGRDGRVSKADVELFLTPPESAASAPPIAPSAPPVAAGAKGAPEIEAPSRTQRIVAQRMTEAKATIPEFCVEADVDMSAAIELRAEIKAASDRRAPSLNDFVIRACAVVLRDHPRFNASYEGDQVVLWPRINVGMAVAAEASLIVPTIFDADRKALGEIAGETRALAERARSGEVTPGELGGGTFTVSNLGSMGVPRFTPVINPPQVAILGVGSIVSTAVELDGAARFRPLMSISLTCDHRVVYGADAAAFLADLRNRLEQPLLLAL